MNSSFKIVNLPETIAELKPEENQPKKQDLAGILNFLQQMEFAYKTAVWRSGVDRQHTDNSEYKLAWFADELYGLFMSKARFVKIKQANQAAISKLRRMFMEELIKRTGKSEQELADLLDINIIKENKNCIIWHKKQSYMQSPKYQALNQELEAM